MSLKRNVIAGLASQLYTTAASIVALPLYLKAMGPEAYGLVGFFAVLQNLFAVLDAGLTGTVGRETARFHGGATDALSYRRIVRAVEGVFGVVAVAGTATLVAGAGLIGRRWLVVKALSATEVTHSLQLMAVIAGLRWMGGLYRGTVNGAERIVWLGVFNAAIATLRFAGVLGIFALGFTSPTHFFTYQLVVATLELLVLVRKAYGLLPVAPGGQPISWSWHPLKPALQFSLMGGLAILASVIASQADEVVLSKVLPLAEYGYFTLAVVVAGGVALVGGPVSGALLPRLTRLESEGKRAAFVDLYREATQFVAVFAGAAAITLAFCANSLLLAWTGNALLAAQVAPVLRLYALGNGIVAVGGFQYLLQYAKGNLRLHAIGNFLFPIVIVPGFIWAGSRYGAVGAGFVFLVVNLASFVAWVSFVHSRFEPGLNARWYTQDTVLIFVIMGAVGYASRTALPATAGRLHLALSVATFGAVVALAGICASSMAWQRLGAWAGKFRKATTHA